MRLLAATVLVSMAVFGQAMPVIHIATGPHWTTAQPAPAPPPEVSDVQTFREAGQPQTAASGTAASSRPIGKPVAFSADDVAQSDSASSATPATGSAPQPPAGATPFAAAQSSGAAPQAPALAPSAAVTPQASTLNSDPTGWSGAMADQQQATATPGFGAAQQPGMTSFGTVPGASPFATPGMTTGVPGFGTGTGTFTPVSVAAPSSNPDSDRASALAQQVQSGGTPAASAMSGGFPGTTFGTPGFSSMPGSTFGTPMTGMPTVGGASGVVDPFTQQGGILGTQQTGTGVGVGTPGFGTTGGTVPGFTGTGSTFPGTSSGFPSTGFPTTPGMTTPGMGTTGGDVGLGVQTRRDAAAAQ